MATSNFHSVNTSKIYAVMQPIELHFTKCLLCGSETETDLREADLSSITSEEVLKNYLSTAEYGILSADNPSGKQLSRDENFLRASILESRLDNLGYNFIAMDGYVDGLHHEFLVHNLNISDMFMLMDDFQQESAIHTKGFFYNDGSFHIPFCCPIIDMNLKDNYSILNGIKFQLEFDFGELVVNEMYVASLKKEESDKELIMCDCGSVDLDDYEDYVEYDSDDLSYFEEFVVESVAEKIKDSPYTIVQDDTPSRFSNRNYPSRIIFNVSAWEDFGGVELYLTVSGLLTQAYYVGANLDIKFRLEDGKGVIYNLTDCRDDITTIFDNARWYVDMDEGSLQIASDKACSWVEETLADIINKVEEAYEEISTPLVASATASNGETFYKKIINN